MNYAEQVVKFALHIYQIQYILLRFAHLSNSIYIILFYTSVLSWESMTIFWVKKIKPLLKGLLNELSFVLWRTLKLENVIKGPTKQSLRKDYPWLQSLYHSKSSSYVKQKSFHLSSSKSIEVNNLTNFLLSKAWCLNFKLFILMVCLDITYFVETEKLLLKIL